MEIYLLFIVCWSKPSISLNKLLGLRNFCSFIFLPPVSFVLKWCEIREEEADPREGVEQDANVGAPQNHADASAEKVEPVSRTDRNVDVFGRLIVWKLFAAIRIGTCHTRLTPLQAILVIGLCTEFITRNPKASLIGCSGFNLDYLL